MRHKDFRTPTEPKANIQPVMRGLRNQGCLKAAFARGTWTMLLLTLSSLTLAVALSAVTISTPEARADLDEANITRATASLLERSQFAHHQLDAGLSGKFLDRYLDALDGEHLIFIQADLDEFAAYRPDLARRIRNEGDTKPAHAIYARYLERLVQRKAYVTNLLTTATFDFTGDDTWQTDRTTAPRPQDLEEAKSLWQQRLRAEYLQEKLGGQSSEEIMDTLTRRYERATQTMHNLGTNQVLEIYLTALTRVYDPHSDYLGHEQLESFNIAMNLSLFGVGATLQSKDGYCSIIELVPGGPAASSGLLQAGDRIVAVAQGKEEPVDIVDMPLPQAVGLIRGPKGTTVRLTVIPAGADESTREMVSMVREEIKLEDQRAKASILDLPQTQGKPLRVGVIDLPSFYGQTENRSQASATVDVVRLIGKLKEEGVRGLILDLRSNGGGSLEEAIQLTGLFIRQGPVVQTRNLSGKVDVGLDPDFSVLYEGPLVVLTSRFSASASEILAGALQDYGRALIVGDSSTFGKGTVQTIVSLAPMFARYGIRHEQDPGAVKLTVSKFYRPGGASTQLRGVVPDMILPSPTDLDVVGEGEMLDALPWDAVPSTGFSNWNQVQPVLARLSRQSGARIEADPTFRLLRQEIVRMNQKASAKSVSLNEAERRREREEAEVAEAALKETILARPATTATTYDITLQNVDSPGLPPPTEPPTVTQTARPQAPTVGHPGALKESPSADPSEDLILREAENILADYIQALESSALNAITAQR